VETVPATDTLTARAGLPLVVEGMRALELDRTIAQHAFTFTRAGGPRPALRCRRGLSGGHRRFERRCGARALPGHRIGHAGRLFLQISAKAERLVGLIAARQPLIVLQPQAAAG